jgi:multidrug efflux pump subunit AcrA (membrane-fusion protein)
MLLDGGSAVYKAIGLLLAAVLLPVLLWSKPFSAAPRPAHAAGAAAPTETSPHTGIARGAAGRLQFVVAAPQRVGASIVLGGTVVPYQEVTLTAQVPGRVVFLAGEEGDSFRAGEILASLDKNQLLAQRAAAVADLRDAQAAWRAARAETWRQYYAGNEPLPGMESANAFDSFMRPFTSTFGGPEQRYGRGIQRGTDIYAAQQRADQAGAQIEAAQARIQQMDSRLRDSDSVAPFSGVITQKLVEVGDTVQPGQPLLKIADISRLQLEVEVPSRLVVGLRLGMSIPAKLDIGDVIVQSHVAQIFPMADPQRHTVTVKLDLPADAPAAPGMYAEASVPDSTTPSEELPVVPETAVVWRGSLPAVFALGPDNKPQLRMVRLGERTDRGFTILSGLSPGARILANPTPGMDSG